MSRVLAIALSLFLITAVASAETEDQLHAWYREILTSAKPTKKGLNPEERLRLFRALSRHPVANLSDETMLKYDPKNIGIGYCFGRAMTAHLLALQMGLDPEGIRKVFIVGDLRSGPDPEWYFHVTTIVRGTDRKWYAEDSIMTPPLSAAGRELPFNEWVRIVRNQWDAGKVAKLYVTESNVVFPDLRWDPKGTTGDHLIEVGFTPSTKNGFHRGSLDGVLVFNTDEEPRWFTSTDHPEAAMRFQFNGLEIPHVGVISYENYFRDLLRTFRTTATTRALAAAGKDHCPKELCIPAGVPLAVPANVKRQLFSPRLDRIFQPRGK